MRYLRQKAMQDEHRQQEATLGHGSSRGREPGLLRSSAGPPGAPFPPVFIPALPGAAGSRCDAAGGLRSCVGARLPARPSSSLTPVTEPEYFRRNCLRDLGATPGTSQLRVSVLSCIQAEARRRKPAAKSNVIELCLQRSSEAQDHL